jgi:hypothetical protein
VDVVVLLGDAGSELFGHIAGVGLLGGAGGFLFPLVLLYVAIGLPGVEGSGGGVGCSLEWTHGDELPVYRPQFDG